MSAPSSNSAGPGSQSVVPGAPDVGGGSGHHSDHTPPGADTPDEVQPPIPVNAPPDSPHFNGSAGDDESSSAGQDSATRSVSPQLVVSRTGVLDFEEVARHARAGVRPNHDQSSPGMQNTPPPRFTLPPPRNLVGESFIVGIPAHAMAYRNGAYDREGYGGVEALMLFDGLSEPDMQDLCALVGDPAEVREMVLRPYRDQPTPILDSLENPSWLVENLPRWLPIFPLPARPTDVQHSLLAASGLGTRPAT
ncbi:hypothetical protein PF003_g12181 [Phytophthora fragariae]|nr:hypothetical protein PF003_g12181 [Phytophthora fragariae]